MLKANKQLHTLEPVPPEIIAVYSIDICSLIQEQQENSEI
jgi:hypothetical protein